MRTTRWYRWTVIAAAVAVIVVALNTCGIGSRIAEREPVEEVEAELTLQTVTLEQPDENGQLLWRLKAKSVTYSPDNQRAELKGLDGEFYRDSETIYTVVADEGEVQQNGETLFLRGNLVAISKENELTLEGDLLKWQPKADRLVMGEFEDDAFLEEAASSQEPSQDGANPLTVADILAENPQKPPVKGTNPRMEAIARVVTVSSKDNRVDLSGGVAAKSTASPWMTFESADLLWLTERELITAEKPLSVEQYEDEDYQKVTDRIVGETGNVDLASNIVTLDKSVQLDSLSQPLKVLSEMAVWDVEGQIVVLDKPVNIEQPEEKVTASANQARLDLAEEVVYLEGNVRANGEKNEASLVADRVVWQTGSQDVEATGNVSYQQSASPEVSMTGTQAVGNLEQGTLVVTGGETTAGDVVIEFTPGEEL